MSKSFLLPEIFQAQLGIVAGNLTIQQIEQEPLLPVHVIECLWTRTSADTATLTGPIAKIMQGREIKVGGILTIKVGGVTYLNN